MIYKIIIIILTASIILAKSYYPFIILLVFIIEYLFFGYHLFKCIKYIKNKEYLMIKYNEKNFFEYKYISTWIEINKLWGFEKIYALFCKKKKTELLINITIYTLSIPIKILKIVNHFLWSKDDFDTTLKMLYAKTYMNNKNRKIEILNGKIYVNCHTLVKLIQNFKKIDPNINIQKAFGAIHDLKTTISNLDRNNKINKTPVIMKLGSIKHEKKDITPHLLFLENKNSIHATSNKPKILMINQKVLPNIPSLTLEKAKNPASIVTQNVEINYQKYEKIIDRKELLSVIYKESDLFNITKYEKDYMNSIIEEIKCVFIKNDMWISDTIISNIASGTYDNILLNSTNSEILIVIKNQIPF